MAVNDGDGVRLDIDRLVSSSIEEIVPEDPLNRLVSSSIEDMVPEVPLNRLVSSIKDMVPEDPLMPPTCCIFKIPVILFRRNRQAFIPNAFSFGPLHHGKRKLKATEKIKAKYLHDLISRTQSPDTTLDTMLRTMVSSIMEVEKEARECYAEAIAYNPEQLVQILVIDGCFLIEFFCKFASRKRVKEDDPVFSRACMKQFLNHDLILLENQVPWKVLERLFNLTVDSDSSTKYSLILLASNFLAKNLLGEVLGINFSDTNVQSAILKIEGIKHFVDLSRKLSTLSTEVKKESKQKLELLPSATSLVEAGIKFKKGESRSILDIKFKDGVLEIPPFPIQETTETVFRNLISYEQCLPNPYCEDRICEDRITSYAILLDSLINTTKDIDILCEKKIIKNWLNPEDAAQLFNKLYHDTYVTYCYQDLSREVNSFCERCWPRFRAGLMRNYFNTPWASISTLGAVILLLLTLLQTVYSMKNSMDSLVSFPMSII